MQLYLLISCFLLCSLIGYSNAEPSMCYYCNSDADGVSCTSNTSLVRIIHCANSTISESVNVIGDDFEFATEPKAANDTYACITMTYIKSDNSLVTIRSCENTMVGAVDMCSYLTEQTFAYVRNFSCLTCSTDLCNYSSSAHTINVSIAMMSMALLSLSRY